MFGRSLLLVLGAVLGAASAARGQNANELLQQGIRAYRRAEFDAAASLLRRALEFNVRDSAGLADRFRALDYLGAADLYRGRRDSAVAVFRRIIQREPRHRIDELVFPPEVSALLEEIRRNIKTVAVEAAADTLIRADGGLWNARLLASSHHMVTALILSDAGAVLRELYVGPVGDTLTIQWDSRDSLRRQVTSGSYILSVASTVGEQTVRLLRVPLTLGVVVEDTLPVLPFADSLLLPERTVGRRSTGSMLAALGLGIAAGALPIVVAKGADPSPARFAIGGAVGIAGIAGFIARRPSQPLPANVARNRALRDEWQARVEATTRENVRRREETRIRIRAGTASSVGSGIP
jgi:hypothetical protein